MSDKPLTAARPRSRKRLCLIVSSVVLIIIIALAVGLGVGLTRNNGGNESTPTSTSTPTSSPLPTPTGNATLWKPAVNSTWQIVLSNPLDLAADATAVIPDVEVFDIDLFTNSVEVISTLQRLGKKVICYFSAGSYEPGRPDSGEFKASDKGKELDGWPGEYWLDLASENVRGIMERRVQLASEKGCDAVDPDNVDGYVSSRSPSPFPPPTPSQYTDTSTNQSNTNGLSLTQNASISFLEFLSNATSTYNLSMGLKNAQAILPTVLPLVAFSVNEQCAQYTECAAFAPMIAAGKPVFHIEYPDAGAKVTTKTVSSYCGSAADAGSFSTVAKNMDLDGWVEYCDFGSYVTPLNTTGS